MRALKNTDLFLFFGNLGNLSMNRRKALLLGRTCIRTLLMSYTNAAEKTITLPGSMQHFGGTSDDALTENDLHKIRSREKFDR